MKIAETTQLYLSWSGLWSQKALPRPRQFSIGVQLSCLPKVSIYMDIMCRPFRPTSLDGEEMGRLSSMGSTGRRSSFRSNKHNGDLPIIVQRPFLCGYFGTELSLDCP